MAAEVPCPSAIVVLAEDPNCPPVSLRVPEPLSAMLLLLGGPLPPSLAPSLLLLSLDAWLRLEAACKDV